MFWRSCNNVESLFRPAGLCCLRVTAFILGFPFLRDICLVLLPASLTTSALSILALNISHFPLERWFITAFRTTLSHSVALYFLFVRILLHFRGGCKSFWTFFFFFFTFSHSVSQPISASVLWTFAFHLSHVWSACFSAVNSVTECVSWRVLFTLSVAPVPSFRVIPDWSPPPSYHSFPLYMYFLSVKRLAQMLKRLCKSIDSKTNQMQLNTDVNIYFCDIIVIVT